MPKHKDNVQEVSEQAIEITKKSSQKSFFPIVALGGSAGSFHSFEKFLRHTPPNTGFAFVIIMHLDPRNNMEVAKMLQTYTAIPIIEAEDGTEVQPNHIYVIPPDKDMGIHNGSLLLFKASRTKGAHMSIDYFLQSLAEDQWNYAVAIIFSGMGADGETGVRMIKEKLGMAMAQDPETAEYRSMPEASIKSAMVDYVLPPEEMPAKLIQYLNHPAMREPIFEDSVNERNNQSHLQKILMLLRSQTGHDFTLYKKNTITRRIERRIAFHQLPDYLHYVNFMREHPHEIEILFKELLIGVTKFFRDSQAFLALKEALYSKLAKKDQDEAIRVWIAGCSTGEEAYSLAMILIEYLETLNIKQLPKVQIFATDLDPRAIEHSRAGFYFSNITSEISPELIERFFVKKNNGYVVKKEVREMIVFAQHNLIKDAPFTKLDLLCCRNVMIYLTADLQKKLLPVFHYSLNTNGLLFLGPAESVGVYSEAFIVIDSKWKLYERKAGISALGKMVDFPFSISSQRNKPERDAIDRPMIKGAITDIFHKVLLEQYTPSSLLINDKGEILYINGKMDKYLQFQTGEAVMNIHKMVKEEIKYALGNAIYQAHLQKATINIVDLKVRINSSSHLVDVSVAYINDMQLLGCMIVAFNDKGKVKRRQATKNGSTELQSTAIDELEKELTYTKQQLHTTIEQMETSLEELKSTNEELQSTNEELQSTNEEALTTKEEMQSLNEELMTINLQYQNKAEELTRLNNDMKNLLDNTEIGTIFLDNHLNILRFTPQVTRLFNVINSDIGRSITHIVSNFDYPSIEHIIVEVIEKLNGRELEVKTKQNDWYNLRIMPYRTMDNFISGAVLTFTRITPLKAMETRLATLMNFVQSRVDQFDHPALILDQERKVLAANDHFLKIFNLRDFEIKEQFLMEVVHNKWNTDKLDSILKNGAYNDEIYLQHDFPGLGNRKMMVTVESINDGTTNAVALIIITFKEKGSG
jgi:two-component system CheB/CheR fusion protein